MTIKISSLGTDRIVIRLYQGTSIIRTSNTAEVLSGTVSYAHKLSRRRKNKVDNIKLCSL